MFAADEAGPGVLQEQAGHGDWLGKREQHAVVSMLSLFTYIRGG